MSETTATYQEPVPPKRRRGRPRIDEGREPLTTCAITLTARLLLSAHCKKYGLIRHRCLSDLVIAKLGRDAHYAGSMPDTSGAKEAQ